MPRQFEELVASLLQTFDYTVRLGPRGRDGGIDVFAERVTDVGLELTLVQCKRYGAQKKVGEPLIKQFYNEVRDREATRGLYATTGLFTACALLYIDAKKYRLSGADGPRLREWIARAGGF